MKKNVTRLLSLVLCLGMLLSILTVAAYADTSTPAGIVEAAYALADGESLEGTYTLTGTIISIDTPYNSSYKNITVTIAVAGCEDKPIMCYRLKGTGADALAIGDTITVTGTLKNYGGTIEFNSGCTLDAVVKGEGETPVAPEDPLEIVEAAYALAVGASLPYNCTLTGELISIDQAYDATYNNITVTMAVAGAEDKPIQCYRLKGDGIATLAEGDTITVTGQIKNYNGTIEFNTGCTLDAVVPGANAIVLPEVPEHIAAVEAAYALAKDTAMEEASTLTGFITTINTPYNATYGNITVTIEVPGCEDMPIMCYRLIGDGIDTLAIGDAITVTGTLKNYNGTVEFDAKCTLDSVIKGSGEVPVAPEDPIKIVEAAYALSTGASLPYTATLTGNVVSIDSAYDETYGNITVTIAVPDAEDMPIICFRMKGEGAETIEVGDAITVTGVIKNYYGKIEFDTGCALDAVIKGGVMAPDAGVSVSGTIISGKNTTGTITVELTNDANTYTATTEDGSYTIEGVAAGSYTMTVSKYGHVTRSYSVTVGSEAVKQDVQICLIGDANGDGQISVGDVAKVYAHIKGNELTDAYALECAEVSGDGKLTIGDTAKIYAHMKGGKQLF